VEKPTTREVPQLAIVTRSRTREKRKKEAAENSKIRGTGYKRDLQTLPQERITEF